MVDAYLRWAAARGRKDPPQEPEPTQEQVKASDPLELTEDKHASTTVIKRWRAKIWEHISKRG